VGKGKRKRHERERPITPAVCDAMHCHEFPLYGVPLPGFPTRRWFCGRHFVAIRLEAIKAGIQADMEAWIEERIWAKPVSRFDRGD
jgi:hypothetical protein